MAPVTNPAGPASPRPNGAETGGRADAEHDQHRCMSARRSISMCFERPSIKRKCADHSPKEDSTHTEAKSTGRAIGPVVEFGWMARAAMGNNPLSGILPPPSFRFIAAVAQAATVHHVALGGAFNGAALHTKLAGAFLRPCLSPCSFAAWGLIGALAPVFADL